MMSCNWWLAYNSAIIVRISHTRKGVCTRSIVKYRCRVNGQLAQYCHWGSK